MAGMFDWLTGGSDLTPTQETPGFGARVAGAFKRRIGDTLGAVVNNPISNAFWKGAGDFANEYWDGTNPAGIGAKPVAATPLTDQPDYAAGFTPRPPGAPVAALPPVTPMTAADIRGTVQPPSGTGAFVNNTTGAVTNLDTRASGGFGATGAPLPQAETFSPYPWVGGAQRGVDVRNLSALRGAGAGAVLNQRQASAAQAQSMAMNKLLFDYAGKVPAAQKDQAETASILERQRIAAGEPNPLIRADILSGRGAVHPDQTAVVPSMVPGGATEVINKAKGTGVKVVSRNQITMAEAIASAKKNKTYQSDAQVRRDIAAMPGYKLVD